MRIKAYCLSLYHFHCSFNSFEIPPLIDSAPAVNIPCKMRNDQTFMLLRGQYYLLYTFTFYYSSIYIYNRKFVIFMCRIFMWNCICALHKSFHCIWLNHKFSSKYLYKCYAQSFLSFIKIMKSNCMLPNHSSIFRSQNEFLNKTLPSIYITEIHG